MPEGRSTIAGRLVKALGHALIRLGAPGCVDEPSVRPAELGGPAGRKALLAMLDHVARKQGLDGACILIRIDSWNPLVERWGAEAAEDMAQRTGDRIRATLRHGDLVVRLDDACFGVALTSAHALRLATREAIADRLCAVIGEPFVISGAEVRLAASAGHAGLRRGSGDVATATLHAAETALEAGDGPDALQVCEPGALPVEGTVASVLSPSVSTIQPHLNGRRAG